MGLGLGVVLDRLLSCLPDQWKSARCACSKNRSRGAT